MKNTKIIKDYRNGLQVSRNHLYEIQRQCFGFCLKHYPITAQQELKLDLGFELVITNLSMP